MAVDAVHGRQQHQERNMTSKEGSTRAAGDVKAGRPGRNLASPG